MRLFITFFILFSLSSHAQFDQAIHCGYDFTSYLVLHVHEDGKNENIPNLKITLIDENGVEVVNNNNQYSWTNSGKVLKFYENYQIDNKGNKVSLEEINDQLKWYFPFAKATYILSVTNEFPADNFMIKVEDTSENPIYKTTTKQLYTFNMYVLCSSDVEQKSRQFGRRVNRPVSVILEKD